MDSREIAFGRILFSTTILWIFAIIDGIPSIDYRLVWVFMFGLPLELVALLLYIRALSISPLSLTVPFLSFTPVFLLISSPIILGEHPSLKGIIGVIIIVIGVYTLNFKSMKNGFFYPFKMITNEKGSVMMLYVAIIYSITANIGKLGVIYSSPSFFAASYFTVLSILLFFLIRRKGNWRAIFRKELAIIAIFSAIMILFHMVAIKLIYVSYMIAIKRSSLLFGIIFGVIFFQEKGVKEKLLGGVLMILGILIISLWA